MFYRRRLPHIYATNRPSFLTWRLYGSLQSNRVFPEHKVSSGRAFAALDRLLDQTRTGPLYLRQSAVANMVVEAIEYYAATPRQYALHAFVVMPNHIHMMVTPSVPLPILTKSLKGITAKRANAMLGLTGNRFWQEEGYDHVVRNRREWRESGITLS